MPVMPYAIGFAGLILMWIASKAVTGSWAPWALAQGYNGNPSTSQLQFLLFTVLTVFAYVTAAGGRIAHGDLAGLPAIPLNLLILMGLSVVTAATSKGITISYLAQKRLPSGDRSTAVANREGATDLTKVQMLTWTLIAAGIYLSQFIGFINAEGHLQGAVALPDVDGALLVLVGASQGGYVAGKLVAGTAGPIIERLVPSSVQVGGSMNILGLAFGNDKDGSSVILTGPGGQEHNVASVTDWKDTKIVFSVPGLAPGAWKLQVRANGITSTALLQPDGTPCDQFKIEP